jgi:NAD(P)H-dependent FMN reductase
MRIALILGSIRTGRQSHKVAYYLQKELQQRNIEVDLIDLLEHHLPLMEERLNRLANPPAAAVEVAARLKAADGVILITPEYHGSYSGVLKNALDYFLPEFSRKPIGVVTTSGGKLGGINASIQLQQLILSMGCFPLPVKLLVPEVQLAVDEQFNAVHETLVKSTTKFLDEYTWFAQAITNAKKQVAA